MRPIVAPPPLRAAEATGVPSFSVIIAAYQAADTIADAVQSALDQTLPPHEIIVCDDGSTDDLPGALAPYRERIVLLRKENGGEASAKNAAAKAASGDFVVILDADDLFMPDRLEALGELAVARPDLDILTTDAILELDGRPIRRCYTDSFPFAVEDQRRAILERNFLFGLAAVRREKLLSAGGFDESIRFATDWECWIRLIVAGSRAGLCPEPLARYRLFPGSLSSQRAKMIQGGIQTLEKTLRILPLTDDERATVRRSLERHRCEFVLAQAREAILEGRADARRRALALAVAPRVRAVSRLKGAGCAIAPGLAARLLRRRKQETTAGVLVAPVTRGSARASRPSSL